MTISHGKKSVIFMAKKVVALVNMKMMNNER